MLFSGGEEKGRFAPLFFSSIFLFSANLSFRTRLRVRNLKGFTTMSKKPLNGSYEYIFSQIWLRLALLPSLFFSFLSVFPFYKIQRVTHINELLFIKY